MRLWLRLGLCLLISLASLGFTGADRGVYLPRLGAGGSLLTLGASDTVTFGFGATYRGQGQPVTDDPTAKMIIYVPLGYTGSLARPVGSTIGTAAGKYQVEKAADGPVVNVRGTVHVEDPAAYVENACAPGPHEGVWSLLLDVQGEPLEIPVYVDAIRAGAETAFASFKLELCLPSPDLPRSQGGAVRGGRFFTLHVEVQGVWKNPPTAGWYVWRGLFTPYSAGTAVPDHARTVESRNLVPIPVRLRLAGTFDHGTRLAKLRGSLLAAGEPVSGAVVDLLVQRDAKRFGPQRRVGRTNSSGAYSARQKTVRTTVFQTRAEFAGRDVTARACSGSSGAPGGCVAASTAYFRVLSNPIKIVVRSPR